MSYIGCFILGGIFSLIWFVIGFISCLWIFTPSPKSEGRTKYTRRYSDYAKNGEVNRNDT